MGTTEVPINPSENQPAPKTSISIPDESFTLTNGHVTETYMLLLRVYCMPNNDACLGNNGDLEGWKCFTFLEQMDKWKPTLRFVCRINE